MYIVRPRCDHLSRGASRAAHGAQYILKRLEVLQSLLELEPEWDAAVPAQGSRASDADGCATVPATTDGQHSSASAATPAAGRRHDKELAEGPTHDELREAPTAEQLRAARGMRALEHEQQHGLGTSTHQAVAFTRWTGDNPRSYRKLLDWMQAQASTAAEMELAGGSAAAPSQQVLLVFGREDTGFTPEELQWAQSSCAIPMGRLQESLSLSHAVSITLSQLFALHSEEQPGVPAEHNNATTTAGAALASAEEHAQE